MGLTHEEAERSAPKYIGNHPYMYTFVKGLTEKAIAHCHGEMPIVFSRVGVLANTHAEPFPGFVD